MSSAANAANGRTEQGSEGGRGRGPNRVLVVDENPEDQHTLEVYLRSTGAIVDTAMHGLDALNKIGDARIEERPYALIVTEMDMHEMDGATLVHLVRHRGLTLPILAVTNCVADGDREKCLDVGCTDYLPKPIDKVALLAAYRSLLATQS